MSDRVRKNGSVLIPQKFIKRYGFTPGEKIFFIDTGRSIEIQTERPPKKILNNLYVVGGLGTSYQWDGLVYFLHTDDESVLIDCGTPDGFEKIQHNIMDIGHDPNDISRIILTHCHYDHCGGAYLWKKKIGAEILINEKGRNIVEMGDNYKTATYIFGEKFHPFKIDTIFNSDDILSIGKINFKVIGLSGHTPDNTGFYGTIEKKKVCFTGDPLGAFSQRWNSSISDEKRTIKRLMELKLDILCHGHRYFTKKFIPPLLQRWNFLCEDEMFEYFLARKHQMKS